MKTIPLLLASLVVTAPNTVPKMGGGLFCDTPEQVEDVKKTQVKFQVPLEYVVHEYNRALGVHACNFYDKPVINSVPVRRVGSFVSNGSAFIVIEVRVYGVWIGDESGKKTYIPMSDPLLQYQFIILKGGPAPAPPRRGP